MKQRLLLPGALVAISVVCPSLRSQEPRYPITLVPPGKGPYQFPPGYQIPWDKIEMLVTEKLAPNLYSLHGSAGLDPAHPDAAGGRVAVLFGSDGVLMVDTEDTQLAAKTLETIRTFTSAPIKIVVNSHIHPDHTGGNAFFAKQGAVIFAQENLRQEMISPPGNPGRAPDPAAVPTATYQYSSPGNPAVTIHMNGETVDFIPMMPSHTAGDTLVRFNQANVIYIEDFYRNFGYPFADQANGGSIKGMIEAVDLIEKIAGPETTLIPGKPSQESNANWVIGETFGHSRRSIIAADAAGGQGMITDNDMIPLVRDIDLGSVGLLILQREPLQPFVQRRRTAVKRR